MMDLERTQAARDLRHMVTNIAGEQPVTVVSGARVPHTLSGDTIILDITGLLFWEIDDWDGTKNWNEA